MTETHLVAALRKGYAALAPADRKQKIRELVAESEDNRKFIRKFFPNFYAEAFPSRSRGAARTWEAGSRRGRLAKLR